MGKFFYEKNEYLLNHDVNKTFEEILWMSTEEFRQWCIDLRHIVVYTWDILGIPPRVGYNESEIIDQFKKLQNFPVHEFLVKDELTGKKDVIRNTQILGNAVNQFFPGMMKTRINYTDDDSDGKSIYDFFARDDLLERFITYASRHFKRDSFYHYSLPIKISDKIQYGELPVSDNGLDWILEFENNFRGKTEYDYWLIPVDADKEYTGYNEDIKSRKFLTIDDNVLLMGIIPMHCQTNVDHKDTNNYQIRVFKKGQKLFPIGLKAFRVSFCQYAVNFPPLTAKFIYEKYTKPNKMNIVWDPSSGWGGRLLGAMAVKDDRNILYLGNDPNTDHNTKKGRTKYHEIYDFYRTNVKRGGIFIKPHNIMEFWQLGSEEMEKHFDFSKYKNIVDLVFTSPPYFAKEAYSDDPEQSYKRFSTWDAWVSGFLRPTLQTAYNMLNEGGHLCWNISDVKFGKNMLPLVDTSIQICEKLGFSHIETLKMTLAQMPGGNRMEDGKPKAKYFVKVNGLYLKYEPIIIFKK